MATKSTAMKPTTTTVVRDWINLRNERAHTRESQATKDRIGSILNFIGLPYQDRGQISEQSSGPGSRWKYYTLETEPELIDTVMGAPQFGSNANGMYYVFCLWEDARPDRISAIRQIRNLSQGSQNAVIILYLNALTDSERHDIRRLSCAEDMTFLILDEILFEFIARLEGDRFRAFLGCTLPYSAANPYNPATNMGLSVPPEMFYGRERLALELATMRNGTSIVFGGRQLGKTALLKRVQEAFTDPDLRRFAWFIDLKTEGYVMGADPSLAKDPQDIFKILHKDFVTNGILKSNTAGVDESNIRSSIEDAFRQQQQLQVLAMFDEADAFLQFDLDTGFQAVEAMRGLMNTTDNRFKVVFAGLHNVQRLAQRPNSPLSNLGYNRHSPRRGGIGPLNDYEAKQLIEQPFEMLGLRFKPLVVSKILSYTNRHPSLIQFFCHELIRTVRLSNSSGSPSFEIGIDEVDRVYRSPAIQKGIKSRFEATFVLDPRYHVISLTMIFYQDRPTEKWSVQRIREHCESCCPLTFDTDTLSEVEMESLLNELVGLGILAQDGADYRIRSSLIAQMFGNEIEIAQTLDRLTAAEPYEG